MTLKESALDPLTILIRCDASHQLGFGHVVRCLALSDELRESYGCSVSFVMREGSKGFKAVREKGYSVITPINTEPFDYKSWIKSVVHDTKAKVLILDVRDNLPRGLLKKLKSDGLLLVTIDDPSDRRLDADLAFNPQVQRMDWTEFAGELYSGWEWAILRKEFSLEAYNKKSSIVNRQSSIPRVLVTMGGSDPQGMTLKAVSALDSLDVDFNALVVLGSGFQHKKILKKLLSNTRHRFDVNQNVSNMAKLMSKADLAVASFGVTAYELAAMELPAIYLCLTQDHSLSAKAFVEAGAAINMGLHTDVSTEQLAGEVNKLIRNVCHHNMPYIPKSLVDGLGTDRVAKRIVSALTG